MGVPPTAEQSDLRNLIGSTGWVPFFSKYAPVLKVSLQGRFGNTDTQLNLKCRKGKERDQSSINLQKHSKIH